MFLKWNVQLEAPNGFDMSKLCYNTNVYILTNLQTVQNKIKYIHYTNLCMFVKHL